MNSSAPGINALDIKTFAGPMLIGSFFAWGLFGVLSTQTYMYCQAFPRDSPAIKTLVFFVYAVQLSQIIMFTSNGFQTFSEGFGDFSTVDDIRTWWFSICICEGLVACAVQSFYAWRIYIISDRKLPTALIMLMSLISFAAAICVGVSCRAEGRFSLLFTTPIFIKVGIWEAGAALCDILIAGCMTYYLKRRVEEAGQFESTAGIVNRIIRLTIETGTLTAGVAITTLAVTYIRSHPYYYLCPLTTFSGVYATTLMVVLNSRIRYSSKSHLTSFKDCQPTSELHCRPNVQQSGIKSVDIHHQEIVVSVTQQEESRHDDDYCREKTQGEIC